MSVQAPSLSPTKQVLTPALAKEKAIQTAYQFLINLFLNSTVAANPKLQNSSKEDLFELGYKEKKTLIERKLTIHIPTALSKIPKDLEEGLKKTPADCRNSILNSLTSEVKENWALCKAISAIEKIKEEQLSESKLLKTATLGVIDAFILKMPAALQNHSVWKS
jgi:hypothetical protein